MGSHGPALLPLAAGEQYRFTFEMTACVGCHSCEVACAEQNGLPPGTAWRRVGEIEGGDHPDTRR
ncbi:MAG: DmsC/YnfH family molybdoenzyme membrane anchor subunit, partial [Acidimicrobiales bacterium]